MNITLTILIRSFVKPFYRKNAGLLTFFLFMMLAAVGRANEAGLLEYHQALIRGMMLNPVIFMLVFLLWFLYARKCEQFIAYTLKRPEFSFLHILALLDAKKAYRLLLQAQILLFLPVLLYAFFIVKAGFHHHWYNQAVLVLFFNLTICLLGARWYLYLLQNPAFTRYALRWRMPSLFPERFYWHFFIRYTLTKQKILFLVIKIYSCCVLYLMVMNQTSYAYDLNMIILFYSFGLLGHGVLIHQLREMEETRLNFYRGLPVSLFKRWTQYAWLYFLLFIPEIITIKWLTPMYLHYSDAFLFIFFGYGLLLLLNSLLFIRFFRMADYLKITVGIFFVVFIGILTGMLFWFSAFSFLLSLYLFYGRYYRYER